MKFTYKAYRDLLALLQEQGYALRSYHDYKGAPRCAILRHDIDNSLERAVELAELEAEGGARSTYFVLLRTDFYNPASKRSLRALRRILALGHEIGLHFDEASYDPPLGSEQVDRQIIQEAKLLSELLEVPVSSVSMHRPSKATLEADYNIPGIVNSYGSTFFHGFKYLSDSRCHWREPVEDIILSGRYDRLHILTHAIWYHEDEKDIVKTVGKFIRSASQERYLQMAENIKNIDEIFGGGDPLGDICRETGGIV